jgi:ferrous iron transport protein B
MTTLALVGMPNTGKSTLFNRLTGSHAHIGNWPGLTVELMQAELILAGLPLQLVDLPGIYDLRGHTGDEAVVRRFLEATPVDLMVVVLNASQLDRQLRLALQIQRLGLPALVVLNMAVSWSAALHRAKVCSAVGVTGLVARRPATIFWMVTPCTLIM